MSGQPFRARFGFDADGQKLIELADATALDDGVNLRTLRREAAVHMVARVGNLPSPSNPDPTKRPVDGRAYLVKLDLNGQPIDRIAVWDASVAATGGVAAVDVLEPAADAAAITAAAGTSDAGKPFAAGAGTGAVLDLTANADGSITGTVTAAGSGYAIGDSMTVPAASLAWTGMTGDTVVTVTQLTGARPNGGWRYVDPQNWVKALVTDADPPLGAMKGDLTLTTELDKEQLKVWTGSAWHPIYDAQTVKAWIASLNLFEGTVQEVGGSVVGAIDLAGLPDITVAANGAANASHYWVWTGTAGYTVQAGDPNGVGASLAGAVLQVGDWLQVSSTTTGGTTTYSWAHIGGDLLARSRADVLYGLNAWAAGNYEKGALVNYNGALYRATQAVVPADGAPDAAGAPWSLVPLTAGVKNVATDNDLPATAPASDVYLVLNSAIGGGKPALFSYDPAATTWVQLGGNSTTITTSGGQEMIAIGCPVGTVAAWVATAIPAGWLLCDGQSIDPNIYPELAALFPGGKVPDFRGSFLRGAGQHANGVWGETTRNVGSYQEDSTARPNNPFGTSLEGHHTHSTSIQKTDSTSGNINSTNIGFGDGWNRTISNWTNAAGNHTHMITAGGDPETRPVNFAVNWIIKARDQGVRLRT